MKITSPVLFILGTALVAVAYTSVGAQLPASVLAGVYTEAQAKRGEKVYSDNCATCHGPKLQGTDTAGPTLSGPDFVNGWKDMTVAALWCAHATEDGMERASVTDSATAASFTYFGAAAIFTVLSAAGSVGSSVFPAGYLLELSTNDSTSAYSSGLSVPGALDGMSELIFANSAATVMSFQPLTKSGPVSVGPAVSVPCSFGP